MTNRTVSQEEYDHWYSRIYGYLFRRIDSRTVVEDLTAEVLSDFYLYDKQIENEKAFIYRIAVNKLKNYIRQKSTQAGNIISIEDVEDGDLGYTSHYFNRMEGLMKCAKNHLKDAHYDVVELSVMCDFSSKRVADELDLTADNVRKILSRSIAKLRERCRAIWKSLTQAL